MADTKISALTAYASLAGGDLVPIVDISDTTMGAGGTDKAATVSQLIGSPTAGQLIYATGSPVIPAGAANLTIGSSGQLNFASQSAPGTPANGDTWHDSAAQSLAYRETGLTIFRGGLVYAQLAPTASPVAGTTLTSLANDSGAIGGRTLPANFLVAGRAFRFSASGSITPGGAAVVPQFQLILGGVVLADTNNGQTTFTTAANTIQRDWLIDGFVTYLGANTITCVATFMFLGGSSAVKLLLMGNNGATSTVTASVSNDWDLKAAWASANAGQAIAANQLQIVALN